MPGFDKKFKAIKQSVLDGMECWRVPGVAYAIVSKDGILHAEGLGLRQYGQSDTVGVQSLFPLASLTKSFAAGSLAVLVDKGIMRFSDKVIKHDPEFQLSDPYVTTHCQIDDLLSHRIGLPRQSLTSMATWGYSWQDILKTLSKVKLVSSFRTKFAYVNSPYAELMRLVKKIAGVEWQTLISEEIFEPLGMARACVDKKRLDEFSSDLVSGHCLKGDDLDKIAVIDFHHNPGSFGPAGGIYSSVEDVAKWLLLHLHHGVWEGEIFLSLKTMDTLHRPLINVNKNECYGLGLRRTYRHGIEIFQHTGALATCSTYMGFSKDLNVGFVALSNQGFSNFGAAMGDHFWDIVTDNDPINHHQLMRSEYLDVHRAMLDVHTPYANPSGPQELKTYCGTYHSIMGEHGIHLVENQLQLTFNNGVKAVLDHFHRDIFVIHVKGDAEKKNQSRWGKIHFSFHNNGQVNGFELRQEILDAKGETFVAEKRDMKGF